MRSCCTSPPRPDVAEPGERPTTSSAGRKGGRLKRLKRGDARARARGRALPVRTVDDAVVALPARAAAVVVLGALRPAAWARRGGASHESHRTATTDRHGKLYVRLSPSP